MSGCWFLALEAGWWHGRSSSSAGTARAAAAASADDSTGSGSCSCSCLRPSLRFCAIFGTKLGGVLLFRVSFEKDVWLLMARQEQQQRRNSKSSSSSISGRQHQQRQLQLQLPPSFTAILRHFWHEIRWCFAVSSEFRKRCLAVGFSPWRLVDGTAGAAAAQEQQEQQQQHQRTTAPAAAAASVLHCYGVSLSGTHVCVAASRQPVLYIV